MPWRSIPDPVTPAWLTAVLAEAGTLPHGAVAAVEQEVTSAFNSATVRLRVRYSADAPLDAPLRLIFKRNISEAWAIEA
jgi:hypothetical protein